MPASPRAGSFLWHAHCDARTMYATDQRGISAPRAENRWELSTVWETGQLPKFLSSSLPGLLSRQDTPTYKRQAAPVQFDPSRQSVTSISLPRKFKRRSTSSSTKLCNVIEAFCQTFWSIVRSHFRPQISVGAFCTAMKETHCTFFTELQICHVGYISRSIH